MCGAESRCSLQPQPILETASLLRTTSHIPYAQFLLHLVLKALAEGTCLPSYQWAGGGGGAGGRPWTPDLPTDSALVSALHVSIVCNAFSQDPDPPLLHV